MEENNLNVDEIFDTGKGVNKTKKRTPKKRKIFIIIPLIIIILSVVVLLIKLLKNDEPESKENLIYSEFEPLISKIDEDTYYIFGAKKDTSFKVNKKDNFTYQILDENNNNIMTELVNNDEDSIIKAPDELYTPGKTYTIKINNGTFSSDELKEAKKIIFNVARPAANNYALKEGTIAIDDIKIENDKLTTKETLKENDIVASKNDKKIINCYKITKVNADGTYSFINPKLDEVFDIIDYYGMEKINLSAFATNDELSAYLVNTVGNNLTKYFANTVYAKENIEINKPTWNKKNNELRLSIIIEAPENTKLFDRNIKDHKTNIELYMSISANLYKDVSLDNYNYAIALNYTLNNKVNFENIDKRIIELDESIRKDKTDYDAKWLISDYEKIDNDIIDINKSLGNNIIYTEVPGLNLSFDLGFIINSDIKTILDGNMSGKIKTTMGIDSQENIYGSYMSTMQGNSTMIGENNVNLGYNSKVALSFLDAVYLESNLNPIMHIESKSDIKEEDKKITYEVKGKTIFNTTYNLNGLVDNKKIEKKIYNNKEELKEYEKKIEFTNKEEKKEEKEYKYTKEEIRQKLKSAYDELNNNEEWTTSGGSIMIEFRGIKTIDVDNNKLINTVTYDGNTTYTCGYNYIDKTMSCDNYNAAKEYIKNVCDGFHDDYLNYIETGESDNDDAAEWPNLYDSLETCYYEIISNEEPKNYSEDFNKILNQAKLTEADLEVLKD